MRALPVRRRVRREPAVPAGRPLRQEVWSPEDGRTGPAAGRPAVVPVVGTSVGLPAAAGPAAAGPAAAGPAAAGPAAACPVVDTPAGSPVAAGSRVAGAGRVQPRGRPGTNAARAAAPDRS